MVTTPTHQPGVSMATTPSLETDTGGKAGCLVLGRGKKMTTQQLSVAVEENDEKIVNLTKVVTDIKEKKSHTSDASRVRELEDLLREKVSEVQSQMRETRKLREILATREDAPIYPMKSKPHGLAVIFVNGKFDQNMKTPNVALKDRAGAKCDEEHFKLTFEFLGYDPRIYRNLSSMDMFSIMKEVSEIDHSNYDSLVVCVSSHGNQRSIYGSDGVEVNRDEFFNSIKTCKSLREKPKMFFIQACRLPVVNADSPKGQNDEAPPTVTPLHPDADMLIANASTPDNAAYISAHYGSWFVQALQKKLTDPVLSHDRTLHQTLLEVNLDVCQQMGITQDEEHVTQCIEVTTRLRKEVRFFQN